MIEGYINFYWPEDFHIQQVKFLHCLKELTYKDKRPSNYSVTILNGDAYGLDLNRLNEWLKQVPKAIRKEEKEALKQYIVDREQSHLFGDFRS